MQGVERPTVPATIEDPSPALDLIQNEVAPNEMGTNAVAPTVAAVANHESIAPAAAILSPSKDYKVPEVDPGEVCPLNAGTEETIDITTYSYQQNVSSSKTANHHPNPTGELLPIPQLQNPPPSTSTPPTTATNHQR